MTITAEQAQRLRHLAAYLKSLDQAPPATRTLGFDISSWHERQDCGTTACAGGHAGLLPEFQAQGFFLLASRNGNPYPGYFKDGKLHEGWAALWEFFGVSHRVFDNCAYHQPNDEITAGVVADRIAEVLLENSYAV